MALSLNWKTTNSASINWATTSTHSLTRYYNCYLSPSANEYYSASFPAGQSDDYDFSFTGLSPNTTYTCHFIYGTSSTSMPYSASLEFTTDSTIRYFALNLHTCGGTITVGGQTYTSNKFVPNTTGYGTTNTYYTISTAGYSPTRSGYTFMGWGNYDGDIVRISEGNSKLVSTANATAVSGSRYSFDLYAIWEEESKNYFRLNLYTKGGTIGEYTVNRLVPNSTGYETTGTAYPISTSGFTPTRSGYNFLGWSKVEDSGVIDVLDGGSFTVTTSNADAVASVTGGTRYTKWLFANWQISYVTGETIYLSYQSATTNSITVRASMLYTRDYARTIHLSATGHSGSGTITSGSTYVDITITGLSSGSTYSFSAVGYAPDSTQIGSSSSSLIAYTNFNFAWTYSKVSGGDFNLTATEWNSMTSNMISKGARYGVYNSYTTAVSGENVTATIFNQVANSFYDMYGTYVIGTVSSGSTIYASQLNSIVTYLNANDN